MPRADYQCKTCGQINEITYSVHNIPTDVTSPCCGAPTERVYTPVGFALKGGGWPSKDMGKGAGRVR